MNSTNPMTIGQVVSGWFREAFARAFPEAGQDFSRISATATTNPDFGDYQCNDALSLAKRTKQNPRDVAQAVVNCLDAADCIRKVDIAGPGFINIHLSDAWLIQWVDNMTRDERLGVPTPGAGQTIIMDYGGPNICKPLHIGHLRSPNIGSALDRMYRFLGYHVISDSHLGDWGTQFGIIIMGYRTFGNAEAMKTNPMEELERVYVASYDRGKQDPEWIAACRQALVQLQSGDAECFAIWQQFVDLTRRELERVNQRLGFKYDLVRGESFYRDMLRSVVDELKQKEIIRESEGALVAFLEDEKLPPAIVQKSDGGFNYASTDVATILNRLEEFKPDRILYITDERQQLHFRQVFAICRRLGITTRLDHIWFGLMRLPEGTFSTRQGNVIKLEALLDEAEERARAIVQAGNADKPADVQHAIARAVGIGAVKYADLSQNPATTVTFTWDKAMSLEGNSGPYLQYVCARIASLGDKYRERFPDGDPETVPMQIVEPAERALALKLARFPEAVVGAADRYAPSVLTDYMYDLCQTYNGFYQNVTVLKAEQGTRESRVRLCRRVAAILKTGLGLLGIETPERM
jgi:arginyl-tRNA synthetase